MGKKIYIDGNFLLRSGLFYGLNFTTNVNESFKDNADYICSTEDGIYEVSEDGGSMFDTYYVKGEITIYGEDGSTIIFFMNEHKRTYVKYKEIQEQIIKLLEEAIIPDGCKNYFYQQQYISLFANLEYFLYGTLMWEVCQHYDSYQRILDAHLKFMEYKDAKQILRGEHCLLQEKTFMEQIKHIVYHNTTQVGSIYKAAFGFDVNLDVLKDDLDIRHDIVHRAGYTKEHSLIMITKEQVLSLKSKIDEIVDSTTLKIKEFEDSSIS